MLRQKDRGQIYKVAVNAALGSFLFGYELVNISSLQYLFQNVNSLSNEQTRVMMSVITAALPLSAILGSAMLKTLVKNYKGRYLMIYMDILAIVGMLIQIFGLSFWPIFIGRLILGFVVGINSGLVAQYTFSVTPDTLSGSVGALRQVFLNVGVAMGYALGFLIDAENIQDRINWRILLALPLLTCIIRAVLLLTVLTYQIPLQRTKSKKIQHMEKYYYKIYQNYALGNESLTKPAQIEQNLEQANHNQSMTLTTEKQKRNLIICIVLACSNQFCGINAILFYAKQLFMRITDNNNDLSQVIIILLGVLMIVSTFVGGKLMDKWSKRTFLFVGEISMVAILLLIFLFEKNIKLVVTLIFLHTVAYSLSIGQLLLFYAAKMLDSTGYVVMANWFATFLVALSAQFMMKLLGIANMCMVFCVLLTVCLILLGKNLPTDEQLQQKQATMLTKPLQSKNSPKKSSIQLQNIQELKKKDKIESEKNSFQKSTSRRDSVEGISGLPEAQSYQNRQNQLGSNKQIQMEQYYEKDQKGHPTKNTFNQQIL